MSMFFFILDVFIINNSKPSIRWADEVTDIIAGRIYPEKVEILARNIFLSKR